MAKIKYTPPRPDAGPEGPAGPAGPAGPPGPAGSGAGGTAYYHSQNTPSSVWTVSHNLGYKPGGILIQDSGGTEWEGNVAHIDENNLTLTFSTSFGGTAYLS